MRFVLLFPFSLLSAAASLQCASMQVKSHKALELECATKSDTMKKLKMAQVESVRMNSLVIISQTKFSQEVVKYIFNFLVENRLMELFTLLSLYRYIVRMAQTSESLKNNPLTCWHLNNLVRVSQHIATKSRSFSMHFLSAKIHSVWAIAATQTCEKKANFALDTGESEREMEEVEWKWNI